MSDATQGKQLSLRAVQWLNFFLADVQTGLGPFLAAYLASSGWNPGRVGYALTFGGLVSVAMQTPAGGVIDAVHRKRAVLAASLGVLVAGAFLLMGHLSAIRVYAAQFLIGGSGPFLGPTVAAITLGIVGAGAFDKQFGKNQAFNSAGNVFTALLVGYASYKFGYRAIFVIAALSAIPAIVSLFAIDGKQIDYARARGAIQEKGEIKAEGLSALFKGPHSSLFPSDRLSFSLSERRDVAGTGRDAIEGQFENRCPVHVRVHYRDAARHNDHCGLDWKTSRREGAKTTFAPRLRCSSYTRSSLHPYPRCWGTHCDSGARRGRKCHVSILVVKDRTQGTGRFNVAAGSLATMVGIGAAASTTIGGLLIQHLGYRASFLGLAGIALLAFGLLWFAIPETLHDAAEDVTSEPTTSKEGLAQ